MKLDASNIDTAGKRVDHVRLDLIGHGDGSMQLWWVARAFDDGSTQPEGMFVDRASAEELANELAASLGAEVIVTIFEE